MHGTTELRLSIDEWAPCLRGRLRSRHGAEREFEGWLQLISALLDHPDAVGRHDGVFGRIADDARGCDAAEE